MFSILDFKKVFLAILLLLFCVTGISLAEDETVKEEVWEGYLCQTKDGEIGVGWPVIAMGVMMRWSQVLDKTIGEQLRPLISNCGCGYFFWNYSWFGSEGDPLKIPNTDVQNTPRVLVKLRGKVKKVVTGKEKDMFMDFEVDRGYYLMTNGQLITVEYLNERWLKKWQDLVKLGFDPWWGQTYRKKESDKIAVAQLIKDAVPVLLEMKKFSAITEQMTDETKKINPNAHVVKTFQAYIEGVAQRELCEFSKKQDLDLKPLGELGEIDPDARDIANWFLASSDKNDFLKEVRSHWTGDLYGLKLAYWHGDNRGGFAADITLGELFELWSEDDFKKYQAASKEWAASWIEKP